MAPRDPSRAKASDILDAEVLAICAARHNPTDHNAHLLPTVEEALGLYPGKVVKAKLEKLRKRGFLAGNDDPWVTPAGHEYLERARNAEVA